MSEIKDGQFAVSQDEEHYNSECFDTKEEAIDFAFHEFSDADTIWVGKVRSFTAKDFVDADRIIEHAIETAYDEVGELAEDWLDRVSKEDKQKLEEMVAAWIDEQHKPRFFVVENVESFCREDFPEHAIKDGE